MCRHKQQLTATAFQQDDICNREYNKQLLNKVIYCASIKKRLRYICPTISQEHEYSESLKVIKTG